MQETIKNKENVLYYLSRTVVPPKERYSPIKGVCTNICHLKIMALPLTLFNKINLKVVPLKISRPILNGRLAKWDCFDDMI